MKTIFSALAAMCFALPALGEAPKPTDFIRVDEDAKAARLQTAVTRYEKDGVAVDLIGAVHIADAAYYQGLTKRFEGYQAVLYEMVGGENANLPKDAKEKEAEEKQRDLSGLHQLYTMVARFLALTGQMGSIDYTKGNFVHADVTMEEFKRLQDERGESIFGFAEKAQQEGGAKQPDPAKLMQAMLSGNSNKMKLEIIHTLGGGDDQIKMFAGESAIIGDRNAKCLQVFDAQVGKGRKKLAIFYGAAHFPDMEKRLLEKGYKKTKQEWATAWDVPKPEAVQPAPAEPLKKAS